MVGTGVGVGVMLIGEGPGGEEEGSESATRAGRSILVPDLSDDVATTVDDTDRCIGDMFRSEPEPPACCMSGLRFAKLPLARFSILVPALSRSMSIPSTLIENFLLLFSAVHFLYRGSRSSSGASLRSNME